MKKAFLFFILITLSLTIMAQRDVFCLGPKIGYNSNTLSNNYDSIRSGINNSFQLGAFIRFGKKVYFQPEANYQLVDGNLSSSSSQAVLSQDISVKSLKIPALLGYKLINDDKVNIRILVGPAFTFLFDKNLDPSEMDQYWPIQSVEDLKNSIWSIQAGAGIDVLFLTLDVRYEFGIENIYNGSSDFELKQNTFNVSLGIKFL